MNQNQEWYGEPHKLIVHSASEDDVLEDYDVEHPPGCPEVDLGGYYDENCHLGCLMRDQGLEECLGYSGFKIIHPGTYQIRSWGRKYHNWEFGWEYDAGIEIIDPDEEDDG